jgi:Transposase
MGWSGRVPAPPTSNADEGARFKEHAMSSRASGEIAVIGIDIGKNSFHIVGLDKRGAIILRQKWSRGQVEARFANIPPCLIGMEGCVGAHHLSRKLSRLGHDARLMPAKYVRPYSKGQKNDFRDAEAIAEAVQRPTMRFVATKTSEQTRLAGATPGARAIGQSAHRHHQSNPGFSAGARFRCATGATLSARRAAAHSRHFLRGPFA